MDYKTHITLNCLSIHTIKMIYETIIRIIVDNSVGLYTTMKDYWSFLTVSWVYILIFILIYTWVIVWFDPKWRKDYGRTKQSNGKLTDPTRQARETI